MPKYCKTKKLAAHSSSPATDRNLAVRLARAKANDKNLTRKRLREKEQQRASGFSIKMKLTCSGKHAQKDSIIYISTRHPADLINVF
jgi:hypothetical protein